MARAALTKLFILVILTFIICLPEFFTLYRVSKANFFCLPYQPCERGSGLENEKTGYPEIKREDICDPSQTAEWMIWEQACTQGNQSSMTDPPSDSSRGCNDSKRSWFVCQADMDMAELNNNVSASATSIDEHLEVAVELQLCDTETLKLTLYGLNNHSSLDLYPPEKQEVEDKKKGDEGQKAFYHCLPFLPTSKSANQRCCLLWLANQTVSTVTAKEKLPWKRTRRDEWWCITRVLWLALLCVVLLAIVTTVLRQIYMEKCSCKKPTKYPIYNFTGQQFKDGNKHTKIFPKGGDNHFYMSRPLSELSAIEEESYSQEDTEILLDGNIDHSYTANLYHRVYSSASSLTEEQPKEKSTEISLK